ncbi:unnamed protein product [Peniophora sp. CBMAI 1063]|nr:unnamed protein product [Peniophora sp. CBMAI 1063]
MSSTPTLEPVSVLPKDFLSKSEALFKVVFTGHTKEVKHQLDELKSVGATKLSTLQKASTTALSAAPGEPTPVLDFSTLDFGGLHSIILPQKVPPPPTRPPPTNNM